MTASLCRGHSMNTKLHVTLGTTWKVIGSTLAVDAIDNIGTSASTVGIFRLDGLKVASGTGNLCNNTLLNSINIDEAGNTAPGSFGYEVATGTAAAILTPFTLSQARSPLAFPSPPRSGWQDWAGPSCSLPEGGNNPGARLWRRAADDFQQVVEDPLPHSSLCCPVPHPAESVKPGNCAAAAGRAGRAGTSGSFAHRNREFLPPS